MFIPLFVGVFSTEKSLFSEGKAGTPLTPTKSYEHSNSHAGMRIDQQADPHYTVVSSLG